jgi:hypothetical protein
MSDDIIVTPVGDAGVSGGGAGPTYHADPYRPWTRPLTYVSFALGMAATSFLWFTLSPYAIVTGWFALGLGIPAVLMANKEIDRFPEAAHHGFIKWGKRTGKLSIVLGPLGAVLWIVILAVGFGSRLF